MTSSGTSPAATTVVIEGAPSLLALHKTLLEAKFHPDPQNADIAGSPLVAAIAMRVFDAIVATEEQAGNAKKAGEWRRWRSVVDKPWIVAQVASYARTNPNWRNWDVDTRRDYLRCALSPFEAPPDQISRLLEEIGEGSSTSEP